MFKRRKKSIFAPNIRLGFYREILDKYKYRKNEQSPFGCLNLVNKSEKYLIGGVSCAAEEFVKENFPEFYAQRPETIPYTKESGWWPLLDYDSRIEAFTKAIILTEKSIEKGGIMNRIFLYLKNL